MFKKNVIFLLLTILRLTICSKQGFVSENELQYIGYVICGKTFDEPCIATLIHDRFLLTSGHCLRKGICDVAGLRSHDKTKAIEVRVLKQFIHDTHMFGKTPFLRGNVGLLEIEPPKFLQGSIPTVDVARRSVEVLMEDTSKCETVKWNNDNNMLVYVPLDETHVKSNFLPCEELVTNEIFDSEEDCSHIAILKHTSRYSSDICSTHQEALPLFCHDLLIGMFAKCRTVKNSIYDDLNTDYIEWSLIQTDIDWIKQIIKNETRKRDNEIELEDFKSEHDDILMEIDEEKDDTLSKVIESDKLDDKFDILEGKETKDVNFSRLNQTVFKTKLDNNITDIVAESSNNINKVMLPWMYKNDTLRNARELEFLLLTRYTNQDLDAVKDLGKAETVNTTVNATTEQIITTIPYECYFKYCRSCRILFDLKVLIILLYLMKLIK